MVKVKAKRHPLSLNGRYDGPKALDGIRPPLKQHRVTLSMVHLFQTPGQPPISGPYTNKSVWRQLREMIKR